ncbi:MAG: nitroreductase family deazaflavin-dependent oxidoreductase [Armatimonadota bacterium]|nr:nitroreductase family deazaflavin-dependent oxidoreductase [Armatimonadota bacterium]
MAGLAAPDAPFLYLTTTGRRTGRPRRIEIWFVASGGKYYVLAEHFHRAHWVQNILREPRVRIRVGSPDAPEESATARVLDAGRDPDAWQLAQRLAREKYGWGEGLPVEITPVTAIRS